MRGACSNYIADLFFFNNFNGSSECKSVPPSSCIRKDKISPDESRKFLQETRVIFIGKSAIRDLFSAGDKFIQGKEAGR